MKIAFKSIISFITLVFLLPSCAPAPTATPQPTNTPSPTSLPTSTPTLTPTPTATIAPTPSASQIAESLGLPIDNGPSPYKHSYRIEGDKLMDYLAPIPVVAAQKNALGAWVKVEDPTVKYGALADSLGMSVVYRFKGFQSRWDPQDAWNRAIGMNMVFTGEVSFVNWTFPRTGEIIRDIRGKVIYRNGDGKVVVLPMSLCSPEASGGNLFISRVPDSTSERAEWVSEADFFSKLIPGKAWKMILICEGTPIILPKFCDGVDPCRYETNKRKLMWMEQKEKTRKYCDSWTTNDGVWAEVPEDFLFVPAYWNIYENR